MKRLNAGSLPRVFAALFALVFVALPVFAAEDGDGKEKEDEPLFQVRQFDEIILKDGRKLVGKAYPQDGGGVKFVQRNNAAQIIRDEDIKEKRFRATATSELERLAKENSGNPRMILRISKEAVNRFNLTKDVIVVLEKECAKSTDVDLNSFLCELFLQDGRYKEGLRIAEGLVGTNATKPQAYIMRGQAYLGLDRFADAEKDFTKAFKMAPKDAKVVRGYASYLLSAGKPDDAKRIFTEALNANMKDPFALSGLGMVQLTLGEFSEAERSFINALSVDPLFRSARIGMMSVKIMQKQYDDAYKIADDFLNKDANCAEAFATEGMAKMFKGDPDFENRFEDSVKIKPNQFRVQLAWAAALERAAKVAEVTGDKEGPAKAAKMRELAKQKYDEVRAADPADSFLQYFFAERTFREAEAALAANDRAGADLLMAKAEAGFKRVTKLCPSYAPAHAALAAAALRAKHFDEAKTAFAKAQELNPQVADYVAGQGLAILKSSTRVEEAQVLFRDALTKDPRNVAALCGMGYVQNLSRQKANAIDFFQRALAADGSCSYAADALTKIYQQENLQLEYLTLDKELPPSWRTRVPGQIRITQADGQQVFAGTQGTNASKSEIFRDLPHADEFARIEADFDIAANAPAAFGLRLSSMGAGAMSTFELEFAKDENGELKVRYKDEAAMQPSWTFPSKIAWPEGKVRLAIDTDNLSGGAFKLWMNGNAVAQIQLKMRKQSKLQAGVFMQCVPKETVTGSTDNFVLVRRGATAGEEKDDTIKMITPNAPPAATPPAQPKP